jgi:hypothetical protein
MAFYLNRLVSLKPIPNMIMVMRNKAFGVMEVEIIFQAHEKK